MPRGRRLDQLAAVLPHPTGPARPPPHHPEQAGPTLRPDTITALNAALLGKLAADKVVRCRKLRVDTTVVEADIDFPTDADLLEWAVRTIGGLVRRLKARAVGRTVAFRDRSRSAGRRMRQLAQTLRRRTGLAMGEIDRFTAQVAAITRRTVGEVAAVQRAARRPVTRRPDDGWIRRLAGRLEQTVQLTGRLLAQTDQRLAGNRVCAAWPAPGPGRGRACSPTTCSA